MRNKVILILSFLVAGVVCMTTFSITFATRAPELATRLSPTNGFAYARMANVLLSPYAGDNFSNIPVATAKEISDFSQRAFFDEPFTPSSLRNLALDAERSGKKTDAAKFMDGSARLTRRDVATNLWWIKSFGENNNIEEALQVFDMTIRGSRAASGLLIPALQNSLKDQAFVDPMVKVFRRKPNWASEFWENVDSMKDSIPNASLVRIKLAQTGYTNSKELDQRLINALIAFEHFDKANRLYTALSPNLRNSQSQQIVQNGDFTKEPTFSPFEWEILSGPEFEAQISSSHGQLLISSIGNNDIVVARQLVKLPRGKLQFRAEIGDVSAERKNDLSVSIYCAQKEVADGAPLKIRFDHKITERTFRNDVPNCEYFWIDITIRSTSTESVEELSIENISISLS